MANEIQIKLGTFELDNGSVYAIEDISIQEKKTVNLHKIPKSDGSIAEEAKRESIEINVEGTIANSDYDALRSSLDDLKAAIHNGIQKFTMDDDRFIMAQFDSFKKEWVAFRTMIKFEITFVAHFPYWLSETEHEDDRTPTSGVGYVINNAGNAPARVKIEITPTAEMADACKIENQTSGESFQYRGTVTADKTLEIDNRYDTDDYEVLNDSDDDIENFEGDFVTLDPGDNTIVFTGTASTAVKITHRDCWL